ncbi:hypothetical protein [Silvimonas amylolytica]|uniref:Uncharacterized protein n=1 Tax=Silvimonas amylolytica TaxID=449663 RepID=A0ABQ2PRD2_9NEIS|nr:hypothetical protein [Silvimonas amylolytica]GGP28015.1 hypothetical protein GCM10010971_38340 [Silvimonas amylolytica]
MGQTLGSQAFGVWYDIIGWFIGAAFFFYYAVAVKNMPPARKEKLPNFLHKPGVCVALGLFLAALGAGKWLGWF